MENKKLYFEVDFGYLKASQHKVGRPFLFLPPSGSLVPFAISLLTVPKLNTVISR